MKNRGRALPVLSAQDALALKMPGTGRQWLFRLAKSGSFVKQQIIACSSDICVGGAAIDATCHACMVTIAVAVGSTAQCDA